MNAEILNDSIGGDRSDPGAIKLRASKYELDTLFQYSQKRYDSIKNIFLNNASLQIGSRRDSSFFFPKKFRDDIAVNKQWVINDEKDMGEKIKTAASLMHTFFETMRTPVFQDKNEIQISLKN